MLYYTRFKKYFVLLILHLIFFLSYAQSVDLTFKDGSSRTLNLIDCKKISFQGNELNLQLMNSNDASNISVVDQLKFKDSGILGVKNEGHEFSEIGQILILPNPCTSEFTFHIPLCNLEFAEIELNDLKGQKVSCDIRQLDGQFKCDVSSLSIGVYILKFHSVGEIITQKFLKL